MGTGLGGGIGRKQYICGAVNAGAIVLSIMYGNEMASQTGKRDKAYQEVREYIIAFEKEFKSSQCR